MQLLTSDVVRIRPEKSHSYSWLYKGPRVKTSFLYNIQCFLSQCWLILGLLRYGQITDEEAERNNMNLSQEVPYKSSSSACALWEWGGLAVSETVQPPKPLSY